MAGKVPFHLDEHIPTAVAVGLRQRGIDVTTTVEAGLQSDSDHVQLQHSVSEGRVLVTGDADFLRLHGHGVEHAGIAYSPARRTVGELVKGLVMVWEVLTPEDMKNHVEFL